MTDLEHSDGDDAETEDDLRTSDFEGYLDSNHRLIAIIGVFGALTVYLFNLRGRIPNEFIDWGITGALSVFLVLSSILVYKTTHEVILTEPDLVHRFLSTAFLTGLFGVMFAVIGISIEFLGKLSILLVFVVVIAGYSIYLDIFPWEKFNIENASSEAQEKVKNAPHIANYFSVLVIMFSSAIAPEFPGINGENPLLLVISITLGVITHILLSFILRYRYLSKDHSSQA